MEEKAPEGGKKGSSTPRKLGTLSSALRVDDTRRLKTLRTSPDLTLGGFPKKEFTPQIPPVPHIPKKSDATKAEKIDNLLARPFPELLKTATATPEKEKQLAQQQQKRTSQQQRKKVTFGSTTTTTPSFVAGPLRKNTSTSVASSSDVSSSHSTNGVSPADKDHLELSIDPLNSYHPTILPFPEKPPLMHNIKAEEDAMIVEPSVPPREPFLTNSELCFMQLPSSLPITPTPQTKHKKKSKEEEEEEAEEVEDQKKDTSSLPSNEQDFVSNITDIADGRIGKLQIYKSGKIKLKVGEYLYDIEPSTDSPFLQQLMEIYQKDMFAYQT